jgi:[acyl-carrier-protein] S-malonyltransferase
MGRRLASEHRAARLAFEEADEALGTRLSRLCFEGPEEDLVRTENAQPAILATSIAGYRAAAEAIDVRPSWLAGHSLGEYSALVVAGALRFGDALRLVRLRGQLMQSAVPEGVGAMAAVIGLADDAVAEVCARASGGDEIVAPANFNGAGQIAIAGHRAAVERAVAAARDLGARTVGLAVSAPFHCRLMAPAATGLARALDEVEIGALRLPVIANVDAAPNDDARRVRPLLVTQVTAPVRWAQSMAALAELGCVRAFEIGPGQVLTRLVQRMGLGIEASAAGEGEGWAALASVA